mmetsp:Transcript_16941/g.66080  ORF Transcript_16941/g.66080 Transcript_16941/m.66080 type:complete len:166 (+) Transcript_16941:125-622(+)
MASKGKQATQQRQVSASCMEYLHMEMVRHVVQSSSGLSDEAMYVKLENLGFEVGRRLAELYTTERRKFKDNLEIIKFICKEFWTEVYRKQIDNLRTNHRGVFVLHDNKFNWLQHLSATQGSKEVQNYIVFPCGMIRGALAGLGLACIVNADCSNFSTCIFTIKIK